MSRTFEAQVTDLEDGTVRVNIGPGYICPPDVYDRIRRSKGISTFDVYDFRGMTPVERDAAQSLAGFLVTEGTVLGLGALLG